MSYTSVAHLSFDQLKVSQNFTAFVKQETVHTNVHRIHTIRISELKSFKQHKQTNHLTRTIPRACQNVKMNFYMF